MKPSPIEMQRVYRHEGKEISEAELLALAHSKGFVGTDLTSAYRALVMDGVEVKFLRYKDVSSLFPRQP